MELKQPLTYDEQLQHLINVHNLSIPNHDLAVFILSETNYYRLTAYGIGLKQNTDKEKYIAGTTIEDLYRLYQFDAQLRNLIFSIIEPIEIQLRSHISYHLAIKYGADCLEHRTNFENILNKAGESLYDVIIEHFNTERNRQSATPFVKHHEQKYGGHFPVWVAVELFSFGNLSSLYNIMHLEDKKVIAEIYNTQPKYLKSWMLSLLEIRNTCAHYGRIYNMPLKQTPNLYPEHRKYINNKQNKIFPVLLIIKRMMACNEEDKAQWQTFVSNLSALIDTYSDVVKLNFMNFPSNWKAILTS